MNMRRRYYNSFFDHINEYKSGHNTETEGPKVPHLFGDSIVRLGLVASVVAVGVFGGYFQQLLPNASTDSVVSYFRTDSIPVSNVFKADSSFASEIMSTIEGTQVLPSDDGYTDPKSPRVSYGNQPYLSVSSAEGRTAYLKFNLANVTTRSSVLLYVFPASDSSSILTLSTVADNLWNEDLLTAESAPPVGQVTSSVQVKPGLPVVFDVTRLIGTRNTVSFAVSTGDSASVSVYSKEFSEYAPRLVFN